jgi:uncharacterized protein YaaN involved in tellurite resistance
MWRLYASCYVEARCNIVSHTLSNKNPFIEKISCAISLSRETLDRHSRLLACLAKKNKVYYLKLIMAFHVGHQLINPLRSKQMN